MIYSQAPLYSILFLDRIAHVLTTAQSVRWSSHWMSGAWTTTHDMLQQLISSQWIPGLFLSLRAWERMRRANMENLMVIACGVWEKFHSCLWIIIVMIIFCESHYDLHKIWAKRLKGKVLKSILLLFKYILLFIYLSIFLISIVFNWSCFSYLAYCDISGHLYVSVLRVFFLV